MLQPTVFQVHRTDMNKRTRRQASGKHYRIEKKQEKDVSGFRSLLVRVFPVIGLAVIGILVISLVPSNKTTRPTGPPSFTDRFVGSELSQEWTVLAGSWRVNDRSVILESVPAGRSLQYRSLRERPINVNGMIVHKSDNAPKRTSVTMGEMIDGCGVIFRYKDQANFWYVIGTVDFSTWSVRSVENGIDQFRGSAGLSLTEESTRISVIDNSTSIRIITENRKFIRTESVIETPGAFQEGSSGLIGISKCTTASWMNYEETR